MTRYLIGIVLAVVVGYGLIEAWPLLAGPSLSVASPAPYATSTDGLFVVSGQARRVAALTLDGAPLLHDEAGAFSTTLAFPRGGSILTFVATDRFGRSVRTTREIFVP